MKRTFFVFPLTMIALAVLLVSTLFRSGPPRSESEIALAFSCGYRSGQVAITSRLPSLFTAPEDSEWPKDYCIPFRDLAVKHGFKTAADR